MVFLTTRGSLKRTQLQFVWPVLEELVGAWFKLNNKTFAFLVRLGRSSSNAAVASDYNERGHSENQSKTKVIQQKEKHVLFLHGQM